jgi:hypothetical protein
MKQEINISNILIYFLHPTGTVSGTVSSVHKITLATTHHMRLSNLKFLESPVHKIRSCNDPSHETVPLKFTESPVHKIHYPSHETVPVKFTESTSKSGVRWLPRISPNDLFMIIF